MICRFKLREKTYGWISTYVIKILHSPEKSNLVVPIHKTGSNTTYIHSQITIIPYLSLRD